MERSSTRRSRPERASRPQAAATKSSTDIQTELPATPVQTMPVYTSKTTPVSTLPVSQEWRLRHDVLTFVLHVLGRNLPGQWDTQALTETAHRLFYTPWSAAQMLNILSSTLALPADAPLSEKPLERRFDGRIYVRDGVHVIKFPPRGVLLRRHPSPSDMAPFLCDVLRLFPQNRAATLRDLVETTRRQLPSEVHWSESEILSALTDSPTMPGLILENPEKTPINARIHMRKPFRQWNQNGVELAEETYSENVDACHFYLRDMADLERFEIKVRAPWDTRDNRGVIWMQATFTLERRAEDRQVSARVTMPNKMGSYNLSRTLTRETPHGLVLLYTTQARTLLPLWGLWLCLRGRLRKDGIHARVVLCMSGALRIFECPFTGAKLYVLHGRESTDVYRARESLTINPHMRLHEHTQPSWIALAGQTCEAGAQLLGEVGQPCYPQGVLLGQLVRTPHFELQRQSHFLFYDPLLTEDGPLPLSCPFMPTTTSTDSGYQVVKDLTLTNTRHSTKHLMLLCQWTEQTSIPDIRMGLLFRIKRPQTPHLWELQCVLPETGKGYTVGQGKILAARNLCPFTVSLCLFMVEVTVSETDRRRYVQSLLALALEGVCPPLVMIRSLGEDSKHHCGANVFEPDTLDMGLSCLMERFPAKYEIVAGAYFELLPLDPWLTTTATLAEARDAGTHIFQKAAKLANMGLYVEHLSMASFHRHAQGPVYLLDPSPRTFLAEPSTLHMRKTLVFYLHEVGIVNDQGQRRSLTVEAAYELAWRFECLCMCCAVACTSSSSTEAHQDVERAFVEAVLPLDFLQNMAMEAPRLYHEFLWCLDRPGLVHQVLFASEGTVFTTFFARYRCELQRNTAAARAVKHRLEAGAREAETGFVARPQPLSRSRSV